MRFSGRSESDPDRSFDADESAREIGGPILVPVGDSFLLSEKSWGSQEGVRAFRLVTQTPHGVRRIVSIQRRPSLMRAIQTLVETACIYNSIETSEMAFPWFPDAISHDTTVTVDGSGVSSVDLVWPPMRVVMFATSGLTILVVSPNNGDRRLDLAPATGVLRPEP
jgi:hypothetical protein